MRSPAVLLFLSLFPLVSTVSAQPVSHQSNWPKYCADLSNSGVAPSGGALSPDTAPALHLLWSTQLTGSIASSPTIAHDTLYVGDWSGFEYALDARSGNLRASVDLGTTIAPQCTPDVIGITSAPTATGDSIYLAGGDDAFYALDAGTLAIKWQHSLGDNSSHGGYYGWCSPAVVEGKILQGVASNCDTPFVPGQLVSMSADTGETIDDTFFIEPKGFERRVLGAGVWTSPAVDADARKVFVTVGSSDDATAGYTNSIARLSLDDLSIEDGWQVHSAVADADWGSSPTLFTDAGGRQLVGAGEKDGQYYAFLRDDLGSGPVWRAQIAIGGSCPQCGDGILSTAAFDGNRLYVGSGHPYGLYDSNGSVSALEPITGEPLWQTGVDAPVLAPVSFANGVVFATAGRHAYAFNAGTGELLWKVNTQAPCVGGIAITSAGIYFGDLSGRLYSYGVSPPAPTRVRAVGH